MKYRITLLREVCHNTQVVVEASSKEEAIRLAVRSGPETMFPFKYPTEYKALSVEEMTMTYPFKEWRHKAKPELSAIQAYEGQDRVLVINEPAGRVVVKDTTFTEFSKGLEDWEEIPHSAKSTVPY